MRQPGTRLRMPQRKTVLIVDDDAAICNLLVSCLCETYDVLTAKDGIAAIWTYERNMERVAAIVSDVDMPRLDGRALAEWVHHIRPALPVILMSGGRMSFELEQFLDQPAIAFLPKPFDAPRLEAALHQLLEESESSKARQVAGAP